MSRRFDDVMDALEDPKSTLSRDFWNALRPAMASVWNSAIDAAVDAALEGVGRDKGAEWAALRNRLIDLTVDEQQQEAKR